VAIWNRVQRADGADAKWRTLDSRSLHSQRLAVAPVTDRILETRLSALGYAMVPRADGNGAEVGGVSQDVMDLFSSRAVAVTSELDRLDRSTSRARQAAVPPHAVAAAPAGRAEHPAQQERSPPHHRWQTGTAEPTEAQRLAAWEAHTVHREVHALSAVHEQVAAFAAGSTPCAPGPCWMM